MEILLSKLQQAPLTSQIHVPSFLLPKILCPSPFVVEEGQRKECVTP